MRGTVVGVRRRKRILWMVKGHRESNTVCFLADRPIMLIFRVLSSVAKRGRSTPALHGRFSRGGSDWITKHPAASVGLRRGEMTMMIENKRIHHAVPGIELAAVK